MTVNIFKKLILVPPKCGSRFFNENWGNRKVLKPGSKLGSDDWIEIINREHMEIHGLKNSDWVDTIEYMVVRNPMEFMISAIHTEFMDKWNNYSTLVDEEELIGEIVSENSQSHWHRHFFRELYLFALKFKKPPTIIMLDDLNDFMNNVMNEDYTEGFTKKKYDFSNSPIWLSKEDLIENYLQTKYPQHWRRFEFYLKGDMFFWEKLTQLCPTYTPTINKDTKKISLKNDLAPLPPTKNYTKTIWCFGDSFTEGANANNLDSPYSIWRGSQAKCIGHFLGENLKQNWVNLGRGATANADIIESICHHIPKIEKGDIISIGFSGKHRFRLANTLPSPNRWIRFQPSHPLNELPRNISQQTINEILVNRDSELYDIELNYWIQLLKYTFKDNRVIVWHWGNRGIGFDGQRFETIYEETNNEINDSHWSERGNKQFADWFANKLNTSSENFINMLDI